MNAATLILGLLGVVVVLAWLAGRAVRVPAPTCSQNCRQGRSCTCMETQP